MQNSITERNTPDQSDSAILPASEDGNSRLNGKPRNGHHAPVILAGIAARGLPPDDAHAPAETLEPDDTDATASDTSTILAERALIGGLMREPEAFDAVADLVEAADFTAPEHRPIWAAMRRLHGQGVAPETYAVMQALPESLHADVLALDREAGSATNAAHYARIVKAAARKRRQQAALKRALADGSQEALDRLRADLDAMDGEKVDRPCFKLAGELLTDLTPPSWIVRGYLEAHTLALLYGPPKTGKSFVAVDWACSIATGTDWHGRPTKQSPVFYLAGEGHAGIKRRLHAWQVARATSLADAPLAITTRAIRLDAAGASALSAEVGKLAKQAGKPPGLIVVDTMARTLDGDENSASDVGRFVATLDSIRDRYGCTVLVVHHTGKAAANGARGSSALFGAVDASYTVEKSPDEVVTVTAEALKDAASPPPRSFKLETVETPIVDAAGHPTMSCCPVAMSDDYAPTKAAKLTQPQRKLHGLIWEVLQKEKTLPPASVWSAPRPPKTGQTAVSRQALSEHVRRSGGLSASDNRDTNRQAFKRALDSLQTAAVVEVFDDWIWLRDNRDIAGHS